MHVRSGSASGFQYAITWRALEIASCSGKRLIVAGAASYSAMYRLRSDRSGLPE